MDLDTIYLILAIILLFIGIALALFGRAIWGSLLSALGGTIGWMLGFAVGIYFFGWDTLLAIILTIIIAFIGSFLMGAIFGLMVELALAFLAGVMAGILAWFLSGEILVGIIVCAIVMVLAFVFMEKVVAVVTALIGSLFAGAALWYLMGDNIAVMGALTLFVAGLLIQLFILEDSDTFLGND